MRILLFFAAVVLLGWHPVPLGGQTAATPATLLGRWHDPELPGSSAYGNIYNEVWGLALNGREYAVIGSTLGTHIIDITRPQDAREVAFVAGAVSGPGIIHRDYHNYGCYLYAVSDEGSGSLQIMDLSGLPDSVRVVYDDDTFFGRSHNIFIDTSAAILYACYARGGGATTTPLKLLDISNPASPVELATYNDFGSGKVSHVHDCYVERGQAFLNLGPNGLAVVDFSNPLQPRFLSTLTDYPFAGYNHSGWPTTDGRYYYLADENHGFPMKILDVRDPTELEVVGTFSFTAANELSIPHNQIVACNYLYVAYYYDGLQVYDISNPDRPLRVSYFGTSARDHRKSYEGAWGVYPFLPSGNVLVSDMQEGLFVLSGPDDNCTANDDTVLNCDLLSATVQPALSDDLQVYPQPAQDRLYLSMKDWKSQEKVNITLLDIHGRPLKRWDRGFRTGPLELDLPPALPAGFYLLHLQRGAQFGIKKIVIR